MSRPITQMAQHFSILMCVFVGLPAFGAERPKVVVAPFVARDGASEAAAAKFSQLAADDLKGRGATVEALAAPVPKAGAAGEKSPRRAPSSEVVGALKTGTKAFEDLKFEEAVKELRRGVDGMLGDPATADFAAISDAYIKLAASYFRLGEEKEAKATLTELARLAPSVALPSGFPPVFQREFEKAKKRLEKLPRGQVSVEGPSGSTAFVDGRDLGMVPVLEENLAAGMHYVRVESSWGERWGQSVEVKSGVTKARAVFANSSNERSPINVAGDPRIGSPVDEAMVSRLQAYTKALGAEFAVFGVVIKLSDDQLQAGAALYSLKRNGVSLLSPVAFDTELLSASTEVTKLCDEAVRRMLNFGTPTALPIDLTLHKAQPVVSSTAPVKTDDLEVAAPTRKPVLTPRPNTRPVTTGTIAALDEKPITVDSPKPVVKSGVPVWVWVVTGVVVAGGAAVGGYFVVSNVTRPVTGTVNATW